MKVLFTSDLHLGHRTIHKYRSQFDSHVSHDQSILDMVLNLDKRTVLYVLGDFLFDGPHFEDYLIKLSQAKCLIKVVPGNHDSKLLYTQTIAPNIRIELPLFSYKNLWVSHCPIHPHEMRNRLGNIHGHLHHETLPDSRYFNVNLDVNDFKFVPLDTIIQSVRPN